MNARRTAPPDRAARGPYHKDHLPALDVLRGIAVMLVLWVHLPAGALGSKVEALRAQLLPGNVGVDLFFVLSGFLITRILLVDRGAGVPLRYFLARRFLRIFPIYYLSIALLAPRLGGAEILACAAYVSNYAFLFKDATSPLEHTWSLAVEEHFYLLWPPVVAFAAPRVARRVLVWGVLPVAVVSSIGALFVGAFTASPDLFDGIVGRTSTVRFFSLGLGALIAFHEDRIRRSSSWAIALIVGSVAMAWALSPGGSSTLGIDALLARAPGAGGTGAQRDRALLSLAMPFGSAAAVLGAIVWGHRLRAHGRALSPVRWVGRISYGLYLYHFPIFLHEPWDGGNPEPGRVAAVLAVCFVVAWASFVAIERPLLRLGARFRGGHQRASTDHREGGSSASSWARALVVASLLGWMLNGGAAMVARALAP